MGNRFLLGETATFELFPNTNRMVPANISQISSSYGDTGDGGSESSPVSIRIFDTLVVGFKDCALCISRTLLNVLSVTTV